MYLSLLPGFHPGYKPFEGRGFESERSSSLIKAGFRTSTQPTRADGGGIENREDNCPQAANPDQTNFDGDAYGDACDDDVDGDGVLNYSDVFGFTELNSVVGPTEGCSIRQLCPCEEARGTSNPWKNHGSYVSCIAKSTESFVALNLIYLPI